MWFRVYQDKARKLGFFVIFLFLGLVILSGGLLLSKNQSINNASTIKLYAPNKVLDVETAKTDGERKIGLSNRASLKKSSGMLFYFDQPSTENCFWMKDTMIPLDMIFLDSSKKIVTVHSNVEPSTYLENFCPQKEAKYGLEINAGKSQEFGLNVGAIVQFD